MANRYVDSNAAGSPTDGTTWATAFKTLAEAAAVDVAGDVIWVSHNHAESTAAAVTLNWAGSVASPTRIICADSSSGEPPTTLATTGAVSVTGANNLTIFNTGHGYVYGIVFTAGDSANAADIVTGGASNQQLVFDTCDFILNGNNAGSNFIIGTSATGLRGAVFNNCDFRVAHAGSNFNTGPGTYIFEGGSLLSGGVAPSPLFVANSPGTLIQMSGFDLTDWGSTGTFLASAVSDVAIVVRNTKLPASWTGSINSSTPGVGAVSLLQNADSTDTNYRLQKKGQFGEVTHETTLVKTGGASDGTTPIAWKMITNADAEWNHQTLDSPEIVKWNETTGSAVTVTVDILQDGAQGGSPSVPLTDRNIWLQVQYLGTSGFPLSLFVDDAAADYVTAAADQADSSATWDTTGMSNPNTQKLNVTFTPQEKGFIHAVVKVAGASKTVYVDPVLQVS